MNNLTNPEEIILCPYNHAHEIRANKMQKHLVHCRKNYPESQYVRCDFNSTHDVPQPELQYHHETCPDRKKFEGQLAAESGADECKFPIVQKDISGDESWDDYDVPPYDPKAYCMKNDILRHIDVESKATKKNFRVEERKRHSELNAQVNTGLHEVKKPVVLPNKATGIALEETEPDSIAALRRKLQAPQMPMIPSQLSRK